MMAHAVWAWTPAGEREWLVAVFNLEEEAQWYADRVKEGRPIRQRADQQMAEGAVAEPYDGHTPVGTGRPRTH
jgi:hypothetical protein